MSLSVADFGIIRYFRTRKAALACAKQLQSIGQDYYAVWPIFMITKRSTREWTIVIDSGVLSEYPLCADKWRAVMLGGHK